MNIFAIIPARMAASRFPGKPLKNIKNIPMVAHVLERTVMCKEFTGIYVATCDDVIYDYVESIGGKSVMTLDTHTRCVDRSAEALEKLEEKLGITIDIIAIVQGDEPMVDPESFKEPIAILSNQKDVDVVNLIGEIDSEEELNDKNIVKSLLDNRGRVIAFSREPIPTLSKGISLDEVSRYKQLGLIFFRAEYLKKFYRLDQTPIEICESVDMMRVLENGGTIQSVITTEECLSVDVPSDVDKVEAALQDDSLYLNYKDKFL